MFSGARHTPSCDNVHERRQPRPSKAMRAAETWRVTNPTPPAWMLLALDAEVVVRRGQLAICVDRDMVVLMHEVVVARALSDHAEIVDV